MNSCVSSILLRILSTLYTTGQNTPQQGIVFYNLIIYFVHKIFIWKVTKAVEEGVDKVT